VGGEDCWRGERADEGSDRNKSEWFLDEEAPEPDEKKDGWKLLCLSPWIAHLLPSEVCG
jgi:hypothetical protein